tara:strand:+ start:5 stop:463 length:459 start_codon:yes stop_codon:yes gene_type:complete
MKNLVYFSILFLLISSCAVNKKPVFIKVDNLEVVSIGSDTIRLKAVAFFKNPNDVGGSISSEGIRIVLNGAEIANVSSEEFEIPARETFEIPLNIVIPANKVIENNKSSGIGGLMNSILNRSIKVQFKGDLTYKILGFSNIYPIDKTEEIKF